MSNPGDFTPEEQAAILERMSAFNREVAESELGRRATTSRPVVPPAAMAEKIRSIDTAGQSKRAQLNARAELELELGLAQQNAAEEAAERGRQERAAIFRDATGRADRMPDQLATDAVTGMGQFIGQMGAGAAGFVNNAAGDLVEGAAYAMGRTIGLDDEAARTRARENRDTLGASGRAREASQLGQQVDQALRETKSPISTINEEIVQQENQADILASATKRAVAVATGGNETLETLKEEARNLGNVAANTLTNPTRLFDVATSQLPSLGAGVAANIATKINVGARAAAGSAVSANIERELLARNLAVNVGAMEGSGAFGDTYNKIAQTPVEELIKDYPQYADDLRADPNAARERIAGEAANRAGMMQGVIAGGLSRVALDFETAPLKTSAAGRAAIAGKAPNAGVASIAGNVGNVVKETIEETAQSISGAISGNVGEMLAGNTDVGLLSGTGEAGGEGLAGGLGMAGMMQTPSAAAAIIKQPARAIFNRGEKIREEVKASVQKDQVAAVQKVADDGIAASTIAQTVPAEVAPTMPVESSAASPQTAEITTGSANRMEAMARVLKSIAEPAEDQMELGRRMVYVSESARQLREHFNETVLPTMDAMPDGPAKDQTMAYAEGLYRLVNSEGVMQIENQLENVAPNLVEDAIRTLPDFKVEDFGTADPNIVAAIANMRELAYNAPDTLIREAVAKVLFQDGLLSDKDKNQFSLAQAVLDIDADYRTSTEALKNKYPSFKTTDAVRQNIENDGWNVNGKELKSISQHVRSVSQAMSSNDIQVAAIALEQMHNFASHMATKAQTFDDLAKQQVADGRPDKKYETSYKTVGSDGKLSEKTGFINIHNEGGQALIEAVFNDANTVMKAYDAVVAAYPELQNETQFAPVNVAPKPSWTSVRRADLTPKVEDAPAATVPAEPDAAPTPVEPVPTEVVSEAAPVEVAPTPAEPEAPVQESQPEAAKSPPKQQTIRKLSDQDLADRLEAIESEIDAEGSSPERETYARRLTQEMNYRSQRGYRDADAQEARTEEVAPVAEETVPVDEAPAQTMAERFPSLKDVDETPQGRNKFLASFKPRKNAVGLFARLDNPLDALRNAIQSDNVSSLHLAKDSFLKWDSQQTNALGTIVNDLVPGIVNGLNKQLQDASVGITNGVRRGKGFMQTLLTNPEKLPWQYENQLSLHVAEWGRDEKGKPFIQYDQKVAEAVAMAAAHWAIDMVNIPPNTNIEKIEQLFPEASVELVDAFRDGHYYEQPMRNLARRIQDTLGLQAKGDAMTNYTDGIPKALALDALNVLVKQGVLRLNTVETGTETGATRIDKETGEEISIQKTATFIEFREPGMNPDWISTVQPIRESIGQIGKLTRLLYPDTVELPFFGAPPPQTNTRQSGTNMRLSPLQRVAEKGANSVRFFRNSPLMSFLDKLGEQNVLALRGYQDVDPRTSTPGTRRTIEGVNLGLTSATQYMRETDAMWQESAEAAGVALDDYPIHFNHRTISNGRVMQDGNLNPQGNKYARELISPNKVVLDLRDNADHIVDFYRAMAQALGYKTEQSPVADYTGKMEDQLAKPEYLRLVDAMNELDAAEAGSQEAQDLAREITDTLQSLGGANDRKVNALHTWARFQKAIAEDTHNQFTNYLAFELDGKTDGPINALVHMGLHAFSEQMLNQLKQGGLFINDLGVTTLNAAGKALGDLYRNAADRTQVWLREQKAAQPNNRKLNSALVLMELASLINIPMDADGNVADFTSLVAERGIAKDGVMTKGYGAGDGTVIRKLAMTIIDQIYAQMTDAMRTDGNLDPALIDAISAMTDTPVALLKDTANFHKFQFNKAQVQTLIKNLKNNGGEALTASIDADLAPVLASFQQMYRAAAIQTASFKQKYEPAYAARKAELIAEGKMTNRDALSRNEEQALMKQFEHLLPNYAMGHSEPGAFDQGVSGIDFGQSGSHTITRTTGKGQVVQDTLKTASIGGGVTLDINRTTANYPGVRPAALVNISAGDGAMITKILANMPDGALIVYDGWEVTVGQLRARSLEVNQIVQENWQEDILGRVAESFGRHELDVAALSDTETKDLFDALRIPAEEGMDTSSMKSLISEMVTETETRLPKMAAATAAAKEVIFKQMPTATDHMAGAEAPFVTDIAPVQDPVLEVAAAINAATVKPVITESASLKKLYEGIAENGLVSMTGADLKLLLTNHKFARAVDGSIFKMLSSVIPENLSIFIGSSELVTAKQAELFPNTDFGSGSDVGSYFNNTMFLKNASEETLLHELVHATTYSLIQRANEGGQGMTQSQIEAAQSLEILAREFAAMPIRPGSQQSHVQVVVNRYLNQGLKTEAVNEFMAWAMTNPTLRGALREKTGSSALKAMAKKVVFNLRKMLGLPVNESTETFLMQVMGNVSRLVEGPSISPTAMTTSLLQSLPGPQSQADQTRLNEITDQFNKVLQLVPVDGREWKDVRGGVFDSGLISAKTLNNAMNAGFAFSEQEQTTFLTVAAAFSSMAQMDPATLTAMANIHADVVKQLNPADFFDDPAIQGLVETAIAQSRYEHMIGATGTVTDAAGRSNMLTNFIAMALVNPMLRAKLETLKPSKVDRESKTLDDKVRNLTTDTFNALSSASVAIKKSYNQREAIDSLATRLAQVQQKIVASQKTAPSMIEQGEYQVRRQMERLDNFGNDKLENWDPQSTAGKIVAGTLTMIQGVLTPQAAQKVSEVSLSLINEKNTWKPFAELIAEVVGTNSQNWPIHKMLTQAKDMVSTVRQRLREEGPAEIQKFFKKPLNQEQAKVLYKAAGKTDLQVLLNKFSGAQIKAMLDTPAELTFAVDSLVQKLPSAHKAVWERTTRDLAEQMIHGQASGHGQLLYANAAAMARLLDSMSTVDPADAKTAEPLLDQIVTLRAMELLADKEKQTLSNLLDTEKDGMKALLTLLRNTTEKEALGQDFNRWKGYIPTSRDPRNSVVLAKVTDAENLLKRGYTRLMPYNTDAADTVTGMHYYVAQGHAGRATYNQGAMQTVELTAGGVERLTGFSVDPGMGAVIRSPKLVAKINSIKSFSKGKHGLRPIFDEKGKVTAYERILDPGVMAAQMNGRDDITQSMGIWLGRQAEESIAQSMNDVVANEMLRRWNEDKKEKAGEYVNIAQGKTAVERDMWNSIPEQTRDMLKKKFGGAVMVRKDMRNNTVGYRSASVSDVFTGLSELPEGLRKTVESAAYGLLGKDAYRYLVLGERALQGAVSLAKDIIIVRSGVVALANSLSNQLQLLANGIPATQLLQIQTKKGAEAETHLRNQKKIAQLTLKLESTSNATERRSIEREMQRLNDASKRLSIWPLLEAGMLPKISEGLSEQDEYTLISDVTGWLENKSKQLPPGLNRAARYAVMAKDTALYQGMNRFIQFSDFVAKGAIYDKLIAEGQTKEYALQMVSETFVNYDLLPGRTRTALEQMGLTWFLNYKLRMQKIILRTMRENPIRFMGAMGVGGFTGIDTLNDSAAYNAHWDAALGPGQLFRAYEMPMWQQLIR